MKVNQAHFYLGWNNGAASWTFSIGSIIGRCCCLRRAHINCNEIRTLWDFPAFHFTTKKKQKRSIWETQFIVHSRGNVACRVIAVDIVARQMSKKTVPFSPAGRWLRRRGTIKLIILAQTGVWSARACVFLCPEGTSVTSAANKCSVNRLSAVWSNIELRLETSRCFYFCYCTFVSSLVL